MHATEIGISSGLISHLNRVHFDRVIILRDGILQFYLSGGKVVSKSVRQSGVSVTNLEN